MKKIVKKKNENKNKKKNAASILPKKSTTLEPCQFFKTFKNLPAKIFQIEMYATAKTLIPSLLLIMGTNCCEKKIF